MYDYSLVDRYTNIKYKVDVFEITDPEKDEKERLGELMTKIHSKKGCRLLMKKELFSEKIGSIKVYVEWMEYSMENVSPFLKKFAKETINPEAVLDY